MVHSDDKKIVSMTWEAIVMDAMLALTNGDASIDVSTAQMYQWIEATEYLTDKGRTPNPNWNPTTPSYQASLQLRWQRMVSAGKLVRVSPGTYSLAHSVTAPPAKQWQKLLVIDEQLSTPKIKQAVVKRIERSQRLRDGLINYYGARC